MLPWPTDATYSVEIPPAAIILASAGVTFTMMPKRVGAR